jgi:hypothetical protein
MKVNYVQGVRGGDRKVEDWPFEGEGDGMLEDVQGDSVLDFEDGQVIRRWTGCPKKDRLRRFGTGCLKIDRLRGARQEGWTWTNWEVHW